MWFIIFNFSIIWITVFEFPLLVLIGVNMYINLFNNYNYDLQNLNFKTLKNVFRLINMEM